MATRSRALGLVGCLLALTPARALAAGFDCHKAATSVEKRICADPELSDLDGKMSALYAALSKSLSGEAQRLLKDDQRAWVQDRNGAKDPKALRAAYLERLSELEVKRRALAGTSSPLGEYAVIHGVMMMNTDRGEWDRAGLSSDTYTFHKAGGRALAFEISVVGTNASECDVSGKASQVGEGEYLWEGSTVDDDPDAGPVAPEDVCTLRIKLSKDRIRLTAAPTDACNRGCGVGASVSDVELRPVEKLKD